MDDLRVAAVAMNSVAGLKTQNLEHMEFFVRRAARQKARWICFPELNISGYFLEDDRLTMAEPIPGPSTDATIRMAKEYDIVILAGLIEKGSAGEMYISHIAAAPEGLAGVYRKAHLGPPEENLFQAGAEISVFEQYKIRFGIQLCYDGHFPEHSRSQALQGAEIIFIPHASPREKAKAKQERWLRYLASRAYDNGVFVVACNHAGKEDNLSFWGGAMIFSPRGEVLAQAKAEGEDMIMADLKGSALKEIRQSPHGFFIEHRRPELYFRLVKRQA